MIKNIGETIDFNSVGATMKAAAEKYQEIFGNIPQEKRLVIEQMCEFFHHASNAYTTFYCKWEMEDKERIFGVGGSAYLCMIHFGNIKSLLKKDDDKEVCVAIDKTSEWLVNRGWYGLPTPYDKEGRKHFKTAWGVVSDMRQFNDVMGKYVETAHASESAKRR